MSPPVVVSVFFLVFGFDVPRNGHGNSLPRSIYDNQWAASPVTIKVPIMMPTIAPTDRPFDELDFGLPPEEYVKSPFETYTLLIIDVMLDGSSEAEIDGEEGWVMLKSDISYK